ncbi:MAG: hypothetical protein AAF567_25645 [Actinomycetota bacterium]
MGRAVRRLGNTTNLIHGFIYFVPEAAQAYEKLGLTSFRSQYFGSRSAPMGAVGPEVVLATFFNFSPEAVNQGIPAAWETAPPAAIQAARLAAVARVLGRVSSALPAEDVAEATEIASAMVSNTSMAGRALAAANSGVELPDEPLTRLWQLVTVIREYRGDAHVASLTAAPVSPVEALVLHAATGLVDRGTLQATRGWSDAAWADAVDALCRRELVDADGAFTDAGAAFRESIEEQTDRATQPMLDTVGDEQVHRLCELLKPLRDVLIAEGVYPWRGLK